MRRLRAPTQSRTDRVGQLALYTLFHRDPRNRLLHGLLVPVVMFCGMQLLAFGHGRALSAENYYLFHLGTPSTFVVVACWWTIDAWGALLTGLWLLIEAALAGWVVSRFPALWVLGLDFVVHSAAWWILLQPAHVSFEPTVRVDGKWEDSNVFFRSGLFTLKGAGPGISRLSAFIQFAMAPFAATYDGLWILGFRRGLEAQVATYRDLILARLANGVPPLAIDPAEAPRTARPGRTRRSSHAVSQPA